MCLMMRRQSRLHNRSAVYYVPKWVKFLVNEITIKCIIHEGALFFTKYIMLKLHKYHYINVLGQFFHQHQNLTKHLIKKSFLEKKNHQKICRDPTVQHCLRTPYVFEWRPPRFLISK